MTDKPEVHQVYAHIHLPSPWHPAGQVARGHYIVVDGVVTMTAPDGEPAIDESGKSYTHKLAPNEEAHVIAARLTKELRSALRGKSSGPSNFGGPINYNNKGIV